MKSSSLMTTKGNSMKNIFSKQITQTVGKRVDEAAKKEFAESSDNTYRTAEFSEFSDR